MFEQLITYALAEDLDASGDVTTNCIISDQTSHFRVNAREDLVFAGAVVINNLLQMFPDCLSFTKEFPDGSIAYRGDCLFQGSGTTARILSIERVLLNLLQRASGIATITRQFVELVKSTNTEIRSTRKTAPGLRKFDLYAVRVGGGKSYRTGLYDGVMIKDNHIASCSGITACVRKIRDKLGDVVITVECDTLEQVEESLQNAIHTVMLDNMSIKDIRTAVALVKRRAKTEASGGITLQNVREIAECGVDYISVGCITNSVICKDIGLDFL
ncbi:carboxylating nicotinate-nucleotide pyrophosphorylase [Anaplasma platys]|uniref:nicotinate-nucleotide diphosphorylase (carboxylating) n=1 Tax=Anaplasma platys TaxID=949 RepID=A0A858PX45_9RICK|nr:carboxylating nicotinate-nucleotide diphosphorylase [Anaplasma platys]QJC27154.1 carboxylating nicotinate-nucleotide pyrophosphorylase [Anaplasma platys]